MYAFTNWIYSGRKFFEFFVKKINLDLIIQKAIVFIFIAVLMYFSIKIGNKLINKFANCPLLILDEWLINSMSEQEIEFIFELIERRYQNKSTIFCTQFKIESWHNRLGGGVHADAIMDRIIHNSITINAGDVNMREVTSNMNTE